MKGRTDRNKWEAPDGQHYTRLVRCLSIIRRLKRCPLHVTTLAAQYGVGNRSIERDIAVLVMAGYTIRNDAGKGWYNLERTR